MTKSISLLGKGQSALSLRLRLTSDETQGREPPERGASHKPCQSVVVVSLDREVQVIWGNAVVCETPLHRSMIGSSEKEEKGLPAFALPNHSCGNRFCPRVDSHSTMSRGSAGA